MNKKTIKISEGELREMISESLRSFGKGMGAVGKKWRMMLEKPMERHTFRN